MKDSNDVRRVVCCALVLPLLAVISARAETGPLIHDGVIQAPVAKVWDAFTTADGLKSWMTAHADFDLRIGGKMRTNYNKDGTLGDKNTIENTILAYEPQRMLTIKATKAPETFPFKNAIEKMWTVVYFEPLGPDRTRLRCVSMGFTEDEESQKMRQFFDRGNAYTVSKIQEHFAPAATQPAGDVLELTGKLIGEWEHHSKLEGHPFNARTVTTSGADEKSVMTQVWLDEGKGAYCHGYTQVWREPVSKRVLFQNIDEKGTVARGELRASAPNTLEWDWNAQALDGTSIVYRVNTIFDGPDRYTMELFLRDGEKWQQLFSLPFQRKAAAATRPSP